MAQLYLPRNALTALLWTVVLVCGGAGNIFAQSEKIIIRRLPYIIVQPGSYILDRDFKLTSLCCDGIIIRSDNVELDLRGHTITGPRAARIACSGIYVRSHQRVRIHDGNVVGFCAGVYLTGSNEGDPGGRNRRNVVENIHIRAATYIGIKLDYAENCLVEHCRVEQIGGSALNNCPIGIQSMGGRSNRFTNNVLTEIFSDRRGVSFGFYSYDHNDRFLNNLISGCDFGLVISEQSRFDGNTIRARKKAIEVHPQ